MSSFAGRTRRGAKARRTTKQTSDRIPSSDFTSEHQPKTPQDRGHYGRQDPMHNFFAGKASAFIRKGVMTTAISAADYDSRSKPHIPHRGAEPWILIPVRTNPTTLDHGQIYCLHTSSRRNRFQKRVPTRSGGDKGTPSELPYGGASRRQNQTRH